MTDSQLLDRPTPTRTAPSAVVWINGRQSLVAATDAVGAVTVEEVERGTLPEASFLAHVVEAIGDRERVVILGPSSVRLALEREYVTIFRRPERLVDVEPAGPLTRDELVDRLHALST